MNRKFWIWLGGLAAALFVVGGIWLAAINDSQGEEASDIALDLELQQANQVQMPNGSIMYAVDDQAINLIFHMDRMLDPAGVQIQVHAKDGHGVMLGEGNSLLKLGEIADETIFTPVNKGIRLWAQLPVRILGGEQEFKIIINKANSAEILFETPINLES